MKELSLNILDIAQNSVAAGASRIGIEIVEDTEKNLLSITVRDNGRGMDEALLHSVIDPFVTTRSTRKVGLGIPLFRQEAMDCDGDFTIRSAPGEGTTVRATFRRDHIDRKPLGNLAASLRTLITLNTRIDFSYSHTVDQKRFELSTGQLRETLGEVPLDTPEVGLWLEEFLTEQINNLYGGAPL